MTDTMLERAAKAAAARDGAVWADLLDDEATSFGDSRTTYRERVRAVVESIREPNNAMIDAGRPHVDGYEDMRSFYSAWQAAIDEILREGEKG